MPDDQSDPKQESGPETEAHKRPAHPGAPEEPERLVGRSDDQSDEPEVEAHGIKRTKAG